MDSKTDSLYDPVRDYVESALKAEDRGGVQVSRTIEEKLKNKIMQFANHTVDISSNPLTFQNAGNKSIPFSCGKVEGSSKQNGLSFKVLVTRLRLQLNRKKTVYETNKSWNNYWHKVCKGNPHARKQTLRRGIVFPGSRLKVVKSKCIHEIGISGTVVKETRNTFILEIVKNKIRSQGPHSKSTTISKKIQVVLKANRIFMIMLPKAKGDVDDNIKLGETGKGDFVLVRGDDLLKK